MHFITFYNVFLNGVVHFIWLTIEIILFTLYNIYIGSQKRKLAENPNFVIKVDS